MYTNTIFYIILLHFYGLRTSETCQPANDGTSGKYTCSKVNVEDVQTFTCKVQNHDCEATKNTFTTTAGTSGTLSFYVQLKMKTYFTENVQVTVESVSPTAGTKLLNNENIKYVFPDNESPRIDCGDVVTSDDGFTAYQSCDAYLAVVDNNVENVNPSTNGCTFTLTQNDAIPDKHLFKKQITIKYENTGKKCKHLCAAELRINQKLTGEDKKSIQKSHTFECEAAKISTIGHDTESRQITFVVDAKFQFTQIVLKMTPGSVTFDDSTTTKTLTFQAANSKTQTISYKISNNANSNKAFTIEFDVQQEGDISVTKSSTTYTYILKNDERYSIKCDSNDVSLCPTIGQCQYTCKIVGKDSSLTLEIEPNTYTLEGGSATLQQEDGIYKHANHLIKITGPDPKICEENKQIKVHFTIEGTKYHYYVTHYTICKEPTIECDKHDSDKRVISCKFTIDFPYEYINLQVLSESVELSLSRIEFDHTNPKPFEIKIPYKQIDIKPETSNFFQIKFSFVQTGNRIAHIKYLGFEYVKQQEDLPFISCDPDSNAVLHPYSAAAFKCKSVASKWEYDLNVETQGFKVTPTKIQGHNSNKMYRHNFDIQITPDNIKCGDKKEVTISFSDQGIKHAYSLTHNTKCPAAKLTCDHHDVVNRRITCKVKPIYPYGKIKITSTDQKVTLNADEFTQLPQETSEKTIIFVYTVKDLSQADRSFELKFEIKHADDTLAEETKRTFTYVLKQDEIPSLVCNHKENGSGKDFHKITYKCTIISISRSINIKSDSSETHDIESNVNQVDAVSNIYKITNHEVKIYPKIIKCDEKKQIKLYFTDSGTNREYTVTHKTQCPEPLIYCIQHIVKERKLKCHVKIDYSFEKVEILITPSSTVGLMVPQDVKPNTSGESTDKAIEVEYELKELSQINRKFQVEFKVKQTDNDFEYKKRFLFEYSFRPEELSQIRCKEKDVQDQAKFTEIKYNCFVQSRENDVKIKIQNSDYTLIPVQLSSDEYKGIFKKDNLELTIKINKVICGTTNKLLVYFEERDETRFSDTVTHKTICPVPTIQNYVDESSLRKRSWKIIADYEFTLEELESDVSNVQFKSKNEEIMMDSADNKYKMKVEIEYKPIDWSFDDHTFAVINKIKPDRSDVIAVKTTPYAFKLIEKEKPFVKCQISSNQEPQNFYEKIYVCDAMSRKASMVLTITNSKYSIIKTSGKSEFQNSVYKWSKYQIVVKDLEIKCNLDAKLEIAFTEYTNTYKSELTHRTNCPSSLVDCQKHDEVERTVECVVRSKFPHTSVEITKTGNVDLVKRLNSAIASVHDEWISRHVLSYQVNALLDTNKKVSIKVTVMQDHLEISSHQDSFTYLIAENEKPQILCVAEKDVANKEFAKTAYSCYIVAKVDKVDISVIQKGYELKYAKETGTRFVDLYRWENVKVTVTDKAIYCNTTKQLQFEAVSGDGERYSTIVEHTTYCNEIIGECALYDNVFKYVLCNFTSGLEFRYNNHSCSASVNCTISSDHKTTAAKNQEFIIDLRQLSIETTFEFELNVTLSHSEHSNVYFRYYFDYVVGEKLIEPRIAAAALTSENSLTPFFALFLVIGLVSAYMLIGKQRKFPVEVLNTPKEYYESL